MATHSCTVMNDNWGLAEFHSPEKLHSLPPPSLWFFSLSLLFSSRIVSLLIFIWCHFLFVSDGLSYFLFSLSAWHLRCQCFTSDIQLLAGHSIVILFRAQLFSSSPQTTIQITSSAIIRVAALQNVVFWHFWGHPPIWSHRHSWMSVVT